MLFFRLFTYFACILFCTGFQSAAQNKKDSSFNGKLLGTAIKVDGDPSDWKGISKEHNNSIDMDYAVTDNGQTLYFLLQTSSQETIKKIIAGGITLTINRDGKRGSSNNAAITYPYYSDRVKTALSERVNSLALFTSNTSLKSDTTISTLNQIIADNDKEFKVKGFSSVPDTLIGIYNKEGLRGKSKFATDKVYSLEFAIPLKLVNLQPNDAGTVLYNVMLNGVYRSAAKITHATSLGSVTVINTPRGVLSGGGAASFNNMAYPTDFWGTFKINKK